MSDYLPTDVLTIILSKLPVKSLVRFTVVSKTWRSLITSPNFVGSHLTESSKSDLLLIKHSSLRPQRDHYTLRSDDESLSLYTQFQCPFKTKFYFRVVGTCNGLLCLSDDWFGDKDTTVLWNPMVRRYVNLPVPRFNHKDYSPYMSVLGFGFDLKCNDYKVIRIAYFRRHSYESDDTICFGMVEVYALESGSWECIPTMPPPYNLVPFMWEHVFSNGACHWTGYQRLRATKSYVNVIVLFDVSDKVFRVMDIPEELSAVFPMLMGICLFNNMISLNYTRKTGIKTTVSIWVMKEYGVVESWTKQHEIVLPQDLTAVFGFRNNGELLMTRRGGEIVSYDLCSNRIEILGMRTVNFSFYACNFVESLVLLNGLNGNLERRVNKYGGTQVGDIVLRTRLADAVDGEGEGDENAAARAGNWLFALAANYITGDLVGFFVNN